MPGERAEMLRGVTNRLDELEIVMKGTEDHRTRILVAVAKNLLEWRVQVRKMKSVYETMNMFSIDVTSKCLVAECWCPVIYIPHIQEAMLEAQRESQTAIPSVLTRIETMETPPTLNITNKFTTGFQAIVDAYGVGNYGEVNPMPFTCVTFPFIFSVMFGDAGHGLIMALFGLWMVLKERGLQRKDWGEIWDMFFGGRYIILMMGLFSIYSGFIYNDVFSKSMNIFGSQWKAPDLPENSTVFYPQMTLDPQNETYEDSLPYPFGIDPIWQVSTNKILFLNTYKMKTSVILGVIQMMFGVMLSIINHIHFKRYSNIFLEFIPQVIFLAGIFGYMDFMIFWKWFLYDSTNSGCAPSILITLINMFLFKSGTDTDPCYLSVPLYEGQTLVQTILIVVVVICIPWMLVIKPFWLRHLYNRARGPQIIYNTGVHDSSQSIEMTTNRSEFNNVEINEIKVTIDEPGNSKSPPGAATGGGGGHGGHGGDGEFDFGDTFIHQAIHTIEYCLGSISHTASYLRLWALSLAHSQLSEVLWNMVYIMGYTGELSLIYIFFA
ncbi:unnamed protein product [Medioppia subpectinata]|uniref:V-type proton ATPase subunit a n=1 Tax=Medioppia subpectinata TaxID=1979941 RepID=A0A7R9KKM0_9ACAR|nr:unnamed protein product [Medioppia subpectinata]CAG2105342.1 unnamed protein product [Medioppia subpectinata]